MSDNLISRGIAACKENDFEKGVVFFTESLATGEHITEALYNRARAYAKLENQVASLGDFEQLKSLNPKNASIIGDYAVSLHLNHKNKEAEKAFEQALDLEPENPYRHSSLAFFKDRIGDFEGAVKSYEKAIALDPTDAIALNNKGLIEEKLGRKKASIDSFEKSNQLVGYDPSEKDLSEHQTEGTEKQTKVEAPQTKGDVIKTLLTKEGFKDFLRFTKEIFKKKGQ